jgi:hypothetical protein
VTPATERPPEAKALRCDPDIEVAERVVHRGENVPGMQVARLRRLRVRHGQGGGGMSCAPARGLCNEMPGFDGGRGRRDGGFGGFPGRDGGFGRGRDGGFGPPPFGDGGFFPPPFGDGGFFPPPFGDGGFPPRFRVGGF